MQSTRADSTERAIAESSDGRRVVMNGVAETASATGP